MDADAPGHRRERQRLREMEIDERARLTEPERHSSVGTLGGSGNAPRRLGEDAQRETLYRQPRHLVTQPELAMKTMRQVKHESAAKRCRTDEHRCLIAQAPEILWPSSNTCLPDGSLLVGEDRMDMPGPTNEPLDRVIRLRWKADGGYEKTVFADKLFAVMGMAEVDGAVFVMNMPHLTVLRDTSNKQPRQDEIAKRFDVVVYLGDSLNDFRRKYYVKNVDERMKLMEADRELFGRKYVLFPNPTDGHWMAAIFGNSEPPPSDENRRLFKKAATRSAWDGR